MTEHPPRRLLEQASIDDLPATELQRVTAHLGECGSCRDAMAALREDQRRALEALPPERFVMQVRARRARARRTPLIAGFTLLAAAAAIALILRPQDPRGGDLRIKGQSFEVYLRRQGELRRLTPDERVAAGDVLQLAVTQPALTRVSAWLIDGHDVHVVAQGAAVGAGEQSLGASATIDPPCRDLTIVVLRDRDATIAEVQEVARALERGERVPAAFMTRRLRCR